MSRSASMVLVLAVSAATAHAGYQAQGYQAQGFDLGGFSRDGKEVFVTFSYSGIRLGASRLVRVRIEKGEIVGVRRDGGAVVRGTELAGARLNAVGESGGRKFKMAFRVGAVEPEDASKYEPPTLPQGARGGTFLYQLEVQGGDGWKTACAADADGKSVALPVAAVFVRDGKRVESRTKFTFACTSAVLAKCYRWGYRPWFVQGVSADPYLFRRQHWACSRMARADYCGDGIPRTKDGTPIYVFDNLTPPIQEPLTQIPTTMIFESGWSTCGSTCLNHIRWRMMRPICHAQRSCLYSKVVVATGARRRTVLQENVCDTAVEAANRKDPAGRPLRLFNLSNENVEPGPVQRSKRR